MKAKNIGIDILLFFIISITGLISIGYFKGTFEKNVYILPIIIGVAVFLELLELKLSSERL